jgi:hypothetical protein
LVWMQTQNPFLISYFMQIHFVSIINTVCFHPYWEAARL